MIHYTPEGHQIRLGLNFSGAPGGFRMMWAWYDFATQTATTYRFRLRLHIAPRIMWEAAKWNVIDNYLTINNLELLHKDAVERTVKRTNESYALIKPL